MRNVGRCVLVLLLCAMSIPVLAAPIAEWSLVFDSDTFTNVRNVVQTSDGGYVVFGTAKVESSSQQMRLVKLGANGDEEWTYTTDSDEPVRAVSMIVTSDGGYYLAGGQWLSPQGGQSVFLQKVTQQGEAVWSNGYGVGKDYNLQEPLLLETFPDTVLTIDTAVSDRGNTLYGITTTPGGTRFQTIDCLNLGAAVASDIVRTDDGRMYLSAGTVESDAQDEDGFLIALSSSHRCSWVLPILSSGARAPIGVELTADGMLLVVGSDYAQDTGWRTIYAAKFTLSGEQIWYRTYGGDLPGIPADFIATEDGGAVGIATSLSGTEDAGAYLFRIDADGNLVWRQSITSQYEFGTSINRTQDGGYVVGIVCAPDYSCDGIRIVKLSPDAP